MKKSEVLNVVFTEPCENHKIRELFMKEFSREWVVTPYRSKVALILKMANF